MIRPKVSFVSVLENLKWTKRTPAKIIVNSQNGTLVISGNVVTPAAVSHGTLLGSMRIKQMEGMQLLLVKGSGKCVLPSRHKLQWKKMSQAFLFDAEAFPGLGRCN